MKIKFLKKNFSSGMTLIEVMVVVAIISILALVIADLINQMNNSANFFEFRLKKNQLQTTLSEQVFKNSANCKCLFSGASEFSAAATSTTLAGFAQPTSIGKFEPSDCSGGVPAPFISAAGVDGMKLMSVDLREIELSGGLYGGKVVVIVESQKTVLGPPTLAIKIPVIVHTTPGTPGNVVFNGCSLSTPSPPENTLHDCRIVISDQDHLSDGTTHLVDCPTDTVAVGFSALFTAHLDGPMRLTCCKLGSAAWTNGSTATVSSGKAATDNNQEHLAFCGANSFMTGLSIDFSNYADGGLRVRCNSISGLNLTMNTMGRPARDGLTSYLSNNSEHSAACMGGSLLTGISFYATDYFDNIAQIQCGQTE